MYYFKLTTSDVNTSFPTEDAVCDFVRKWLITQRECHSLLTGIRYFYVYLAAAPFVVYTDHISLKYLESLKVSAHNRLSALQPYKFIVEHFSCAKLTATNGLSRRPYEAPLNLDVDKEFTEAVNYQIVDEVLYHLHFSKTKRVNEVKLVIQQLCVPETLREDILVAYDDNIGHIGRDRLYETLKQKYYFREMYISVHEYVSTCVECQKTKTSPHRKKAPLSPLPIGPPFSRIHLDHVGPLPETSEGYHHLLVVIDATTLWAEAFPVKSTTGEETADILYREIICRSGAPKAIHSDQGTAFRNRLITLLCKLLHIKHIHSSPFHPEGNAKVERANRTISTTLKLVCPNQTEWAKFIAPILYSYRASVAYPPSKLFLANKYPWESTCNYYKSPKMLPPPRHMSSTSFLN